MRAVVRIALVLFITVAGAVWWLVATYAPTELASPTNSTRILGTNLWFPKLGSDSKEEVEVLAKAAYFIDASTGEVLYQKNADQELPVASLVKIMTAIVTLEHHQLQDMIKISSFAAGQEPDHMELREGEQLAVKELLFGIFLISANDAAEALAENTVGTRSEFIRQMNERAVSLGMSRTHFINPTGLQEDNVRQYSTAYDVAVMSRYLVKSFPEVLTMSQTSYYQLPATNTHQEYEFYSGINLLTTYPGVIGLKTGYTPEAGLTLVTAAEREGRVVIGVLLDSPNRRDEAKKLLDHSFKKLGVRI